MPTESAEGTGGNSAHLRVLVVDDDRDVRHLLCAHLAQRGHQGLGTGTMQEALLVLAASQIDVLVTDVLLPDGDGLDLLNQTMGRLPQIRSIVVTGGGRYFGPEFFRRIAHVLGAAVLQKPFDRATFLAAVEGMSTEVPRP